MNITTEKFFLVDFIWIVKLIKDFVHIKKARASSFI